MEQFEDGLHVRLRSRMYGTYLRADEDGEGVSLHPDGASLRTVWGVHLLVRDGVTCDLLCLHNAAYGKYIAASGKPLRLGLGPRGYGVALRNYDHMEEYTVRWMAVPSASAGHILLRSMYGGGKLRVHCGYLNNFSVYLDNCNEANAAPMEDWKVEAVPLEELPTLLRPQPQPLPVGFLARLLSPAQRHGPTTRIVRVKRRFPGQGEDEEWLTVHFIGTSSLNLIHKLINVMGKGYEIYIQAGCLGRLTRLLHDLPRNNDTIYVILQQSDGKDVVGSKILSPNGEVFELGFGLSAANMLMEHSSKPTQMEAVKAGSEESYLWTVCNGHEAHLAIAQWHQIWCPDNAVVELEPGVVFSHMQEMQSSFQSAIHMKLVKQSANYHNWIREYRVLASISHLPCPPKEVSARFAAGGEQNNVVEPWVVVN